MQDFIKISKNRCLLFYFPKAISDAIIIPITLSLNPTKMKVYRRVPSVSVFALPNYLNEFQGNLERLMVFKVKIPTWLSKPRQLKLR